MRKSYTIAGVGVCLGKCLGYEAVAEARITGTPIVGEESANALQLAMREAMQFTLQKNLPIFTDTPIPEAHQLCGSFREMVEAAPENALLLHHEKQGWMAFALTQEDKGFARVEISDAEAEGDGFLPFLLSALEVRFALHFGEQKQLYRFWDAHGERSKELACDGLSFRFTEPKELVSRVHEAPKYLLPLVFTTTQEAVQKLNTLKQTAAGGLKAAMDAQLRQLKTRNEHSNTVVFLADTYDSLQADIDDLLRKAEHLLEEGFVWSRPSGSRYIRRSCAEPKVVFMNSPGGMFQPKAFYNFFLKHCITFPIVSRFEAEQALTGDTGNFLSRAMFEMVINHTVVRLLGGLGIASDIRSGACQGELSIEMPFIKDADGSSNNVGECLMRIAKPVEMAMRGDNEPLEAYLGRKVGKFTKYYLKCEAQRVRQAAEKYDSVFIWIVGSVEDVIVAGEQAACLKLIEELGCVSTEMDDPLYIHTPIMEAYRQEIRQKLLDGGLHLDVDSLPFKLFSTFYRKYMDSTPEMLADNMTDLIIEEVDYAAAVQTLYAEGGRVFIDLSTKQICALWAGNTLKEQPDASVLSIYSGNSAAEDLLNFAAVMLAGNVRFDYEMLLEKLRFAEDKKETPLCGEEFTQILRRQMQNNERAFRMFMDAQNKLYEQMLNAKPQSAAPQKEAVKFPNASKTCLYDREQVVTMTERSMAAVLGPTYDAVDQYPVRARMPLPPFLFVSRILSIDAEFGVFRPSSIVTEFDLDEDCVFRNGDTSICPLVASEASHVAIFLIAYMGLDAVSKGTLSYRAIDSSMTAYSERPFKVGDTLRTVLNIKRFVQNGSTTLLFFSFESYNGDELISITEATGGFFTRADLESNKGIIQPKLQMRKAVEPREFPHLSGATRTTYEKAELEAFYRGDYETCFHVPAKADKKNLYYLPYDLKMVDRITNIDYNGGTYGRGLICGEKQITPDMWPFKVHFKNDPVFPAIITSDGVSQLGMFLCAHAGLLEKFENANFTMIKGNCCNSKFRGQVRHGYSTLRYEISVKDVVETDESFCVYLDAAIFNDDVQIMQIDSYALKITDAEQ